jgi:hypothetical protein
MITQPAGIGAVMRLNVRQHLLRIIYLQIGVSD